MDSDPILWIFTNPNFKNFLLLFTLFFSAKLYLQFNDEESFNEVFFDVLVDIFASGFGSADPNIF